MPQKRGKQKRRIGDFGRLIRSHRERLGITISELARRIQMDQGLLSKIETGKRPPPQLVPHVQRIATALGFTHDLPEFKEIFQTAYRERFGKNESWPSIASIVLGDQGQAEIVRTPIAPPGLGDYAPRETRKTIEPDSRIGQGLGLPWNDERTAKREQEFAAFAARMGSAFPSELVNLRRTSSESEFFDLLWQLLEALAYEGMVITRFEREGESLRMEARLPDGKDFEMTIRPKGLPGGSQ